LLDKKEKSIMRKKAGWGEDCEKKRHIKWSGDRRNEKEKTRRSTWIWKSRRRSKKWKEYRGEIKWKCETGIAKMAKEQ
jgi:hypothetical protein